MMMSNVFGFFGFYFEIKTKPKKNQKNHAFYYAWFFESRTLTNWHSETFVNLTKRATSDHARPSGFNVDIRFHRANKERPFNSQGINANS
jgi:hypothetical protein